MEDYTDPARVAERLSNGEREQAVAALATARDDGRLQQSEFEQRSSSARQAVTWGDLAPLFADLPRPAASVPRYADATIDRPWGGRVRPLGGTTGATIMALIPFIALALFFITGFGLGFAWSWLWFFLIPIAGIVIYGPGSTRR